MFYVYSYCFMIAGLVFGIICGGLTVVIYRKCYGTRSKKHGFGKEINLINMGGNDSILQNNRDEQAAKDFTT